MSSTIFMDRIHIALLVAAVWAGCSPVIAQDADVMSGSSDTQQVRASELVGEFDGVPVMVHGEDASGVLEAVLFYLFGGGLIVSAIGVCVTRSVVRMATWLFFALGSAAVLYLLLGAYFLSAIQLIVYAGGTLILIVFGVMLTSKSPWVRFDTPKIELLAGGAISLVLFLALTAVLVDTTWPAQADVSRGASVHDFGKELLTTYLVPFEVASVMLLVVMIAAAYLARQEH
jgi:NADH:ubiquinone oxidoreductase subunit 6 (subunit J)